MEQSELLNTIKNLERRVERLEKLQRATESKPQKVLYTNTIHPEDMELGTMAYVGRFESQDKKVGSIFGADRIEIASLYDCDSFEMAKVINAFSSEERVNIIKELMTRSMTAKELMEKLQFQTTGKLYHHLSFLEKIGIINKHDEKYHVAARYVSCVVLIAVGVSQIIKKNKD